MAEHNEARLHYRFGTYGPRIETESRLNPNVAPFSPSPYYTQVSYPSDVQPGSYYPIQYPEAWSAPEEQSGRRVIISQSKLVQLVSLWKQIIVKEVNTHKSLNQRLRDYLNEQCSNDSLFFHPLASLIIPPPRYLYINPAITDACLYSLRIPPEPSQNEPAQFALSPDGLQGFENNPTCDWLISLWAFLYYSLPPLRLSIAQHSCQESVCWICELALTFRNLDVGRAEGRGQPVQVNNLCDAILKAGPIASLAMQRESAEMQFLEPNPLLRGVLSQKIRNLYGSSSRRWLSDERGNSPKAGRWSGGRTLSADSFLRRVERTRDRVTRAVRMREAERRQKRDQRECRAKLHFKFHQVVSYCLHALSKCPNIPQGAQLTGDVEIDFPLLSHDSRAHPDHRPILQRAADIFTMTTETWTECFATRQHPPSAFTNDPSAVVGVTCTETYLLELDHHTRAAGDSSPPQGSSCPLSTASSFSAAPSSSSCLATESVPPPRASPTERSPPSSEPTPPRLKTIPSRSFALLLRDSLWRSRRVAMSCARCAGSGASQHIVTNKIKSLPPLLSIKIKLDNRDTTENESLNFWRFFREPIETSPGRFANSLSLSPVGYSGTSDSAKLISRWFSVKNKTQKSSKDLSDLRAMTEILSHSFSSARSPLPEMLSIGQSTPVASGNPWTVSEAEGGRLCHCSDSQCLESHRYDLLCVVCSINHLWNRNQRKALWKVWTQDVAPSKSLLSKRDYKRSSLRRTRMENSAENATMRQIEAEEAMLEAPLEEDQMVAFVRTPSDPSRWFLINGPLTCQVEKADVLTFTQCWKYPCAVFYGRLDILWHPSILSQLPPPPPPLPAASELLAPHTLSQTPLAHRALPRFVPLTPQELQAIADNDFAIAIDAEYVVASMVAKSTASLFGPLTTPSLGRISLLRANGGLHDGTPFMDYYLHFKNKPIDYRTEFSGLVPGDLDLKSAHCLSTQKHIHQVLRYLVEKSCRFIGHDLFNDFRVIGLIVPNNLIIDTVEIYRLSNASRLLSLKFLCFHVLNMKIQTMTHDSIEDAHASLMLYRYYERWLSERSAEEFRSVELSRIYNIGYSTNFRVEDMRPC